MQKQVYFDYFYGEESEQFSYYRIPRLLVTGQQFKNLSTDAKLLYGLMLDRMGLSIKNHWYDHCGRVYIHYTLDEIQTALNCGHNKGVRLLAELDTVTGIGLIERVKQGKATLPGSMSRGSPPNRFRSSLFPLPVMISDFPKQEVLTSQKRKSRVPQMGSQDFLKAEVQSSHFRKSLTII